MIPAGDDMKYKLIVSDLDGTLLNGQKLVSNINKEAIRKAKEQGMSFAIASGRPLYPILSHQAMGNGGACGLCTRYERRVHL